MIDILSATELSDLIQRVFKPGRSDKALVVIVDLPDEELADNEDWLLRRNIAAGWVHELKTVEDTLGLKVNLCLYRNARANNADLPEGGWIHKPENLPENCRALEGSATTSFSEIFTQHQLVIAPTELSATAPLKVMSRSLRFRGATMPGFSPEMIPALRLDYTEVNRRVLILKDVLDRASGADFHFVVDASVDASSEYDLHLDLRHRSAHASGGLLPEAGTAGNLPSGEAYIVPYEGEINDTPTRSAGLLPVEHEDGVVIYRIENNRAVEVVSEGEASKREADHLLREPAYGNLAELGLGVLSEFGISPIGEVLLDEKLGLHIAFGRSEHFGGQVGPDSFSSPSAVIHQDYVYIKEIQPRVNAARVDLTMEDGSQIELIRNGKYVISFE